MDAPRPLPPSIESPSRLPAPAPRLRRALLAWYDANRRELPWRPPVRTLADPYRVLVSEIMLQQTTVPTVKNRFGPFLERFPTLEALAVAPLEDVLHEWQGLGYYRRARGLHEAAKAVVAKHRGRLPKDVEALKALPGIGPYTAAAVAAMAYGRAELPVDGNVARVLSRLAKVERPLLRAMTELRRVAGELAGGTRSGDMAQASIELGALVCRPREPRCGECPWAFACSAKRHGLQDRLPLAEPVKAKPKRHAAAFVVERADGCLLFRRRPEGGLFPGMVELPTSAWQPEPLASEAEAFAQAPALGLPPDGWVAIPGGLKHTVSSGDLHLAFWRLEVPASFEAPEGGFFHRLDALHELALPTYTRKALQHVGVG